MAKVVERYVVRYTIELDPKLHGLMRELSRRKRVQIGVVYEAAIRMYLEHPDNFMGAARSLKPQRSKTQ